MSFMLLRLVLGDIPLRAGQPARSRCSVSIAFWNTENFFDTIPSRFYDDRAYTPDGKLGWNSERYVRKLRNLARVVDDMGADVIGFAEVENEAVVRDLTEALTDDYNYIHFTSSDRRGIDLALLYKGDKFFPDRAHLVNSLCSREFLHVSGTLQGERVCFVLCHLPSKANPRDYRRRAMERLRVVADSVRLADPDAKMIVMGDFNCDPSERMFRNMLGNRSGGFHDKIMLYGALADNPAHAGSYAYGGKWYLLDNILLSANTIYGDGLTYESGGVFVRGYMIAGTSARAGDFGAGRGYPLRTFTSGRYTAGYSDHLPVYVVLSR